MVDALDSKSSSQKSVGSSPTAGIKKLVEKGGSFTTAALSFSALYATKRDIVRHLRYAPPYMPCICPLYGPCICPLFGSWRKGFTGLFSGFECPKRRPPRAATREVFGKCNIRTFVSDEVMLAYRSVLSTLFFCI